MSLATVEEREMKKQKVWVLDSWWKKTIYVLGIIYAILFTAGAIWGALGSIH